MIVENRLTPLDRDAAAAALAIAYERLTGRLPSEKVLALLLAQSALETGHWKKTHNFNFGNIKASAGYPLIVQFRCSEVDERGVETFYDPPHPQCNFRAYETGADGALDYLKILQRRAHWWQGLHTEDPSAFVDALATPPKYFTANPEKYKRALVSLYAGFLPLARVALRALSSKPVLVPVSPSDSESSSSALASSSERSSDRGVAAESQTAYSRQESGAFKVAREPKPPAGGSLPPGRAPAVPVSAWSRLVHMLVRWLAKLFQRNGAGGS